MERYQGFARHVATGAPASGATITVTDAVSAVPASLYSDDGVTPKANPFTADLTTGYFRIASTLTIGGTEYTISQPNQEERNWTFSELRIAWTQIDNALDFSLAYAVDKVPEPVAQRLYDGLISTVEHILTTPDALVGSSC